MPSLWLQCIMWPEFKLYVVFIVLVTSVMMAVYHIVVALEIIHHKVSVLLPIFCLQLEHIVCISGL